MERRSFIKRGGLLATAALVAPQIFVPRLIRADAQQMLATVARKKAGAAPASWIFSTGFELNQAGEEAAGLIVGGAPTFEYATSPAPIDGSFSLLMNASSEVVRSPIFAPQTTVWVFLRVNSGADSNTMELSFRDASNNVLATALKISGGIWRVNSGGGTSSSSAGGSWTATVTQDVWVRYTAGSGANAVCELFHATDLTKPGAATVIREFGTSTTACEQAVLRSTTTTSMISDRFIVSTTDPGSNPSL